VVETKDQTIVDPGTINPHHQERNQKIKEMQNRAIRNPVSV